MKKEKSELIQEALDTLQAVTLSGRSVESYVAELFENIRNLIEENKKLKSDLAEDDDLREELDYRKREDKELRKWIKEHVDYQTQADFRKRFEHK